MSRYCQAVKEFAVAMGHVTDAPFKVDETLDLRLKLIDEELEELKLACDYYAATKNLHAKREIVDAITDLLYVVVGFVVTYGIDLDLAFERVHESNMTKLGRDGKPIYRDDGKVIKGPDFCPPELDDVVGGVIWE